MPKQRSIFKLNGTIDGATFYESKGVFYARKAGKGPTREQILTNPRYERTRDNLSEFGGLTVATNSFTKAMSQASNFKDGRVRNRLMKAFRQVATASGGIRGKRPVLLSQFKDHLKDFELNIEATMKELMKLDPVVLHDAARNKASVTITAENIMSAISKAPPGLTHVRFAHWLGVVSNVAYNDALKKYMPVTPAVNGMHQITFSDYISLDSKDALNVQLQTVLPNAPVLDDTVTVVQGVGVMFSQYIAPNHYPEKFSAMKVYDVF